MGPLATRIILALGITIFLALMAGYLKDKPSLAFAIFAAIVAGLPLVAALARGERARHRQHRDWTLLDDDSIAWVARNGRQFVMIRSANQALVRAVSL